MSNIITVSEFSDFGDALLVEAYGKDEFEPHDVRWKNPCVEAPEW